MKNFGMEIVFVLILVIFGIWLCLIMFSDNDRHMRIPHYVNLYFQGKPLKLYQCIKKGKNISISDICDSVEYQKASFEEKLDFVTKLIFLYDDGKTYTSIATCLFPENTTEENVIKLHETICQLKNEGYPIKDIANFSNNAFYGLYKKSENERIAYYFSKAKER